MPVNLTAAWLSQNTMTAGFPIAIHLCKESPTSQSSRPQAEKLQGKIIMLDFTFIKHWFLSEGG